MISDGTLFNIQSESTLVGKKITFKLIYEKVVKTVQSQIFYFRVLNINMSYIAWARQSSMNE